MINNLDGLWKEVMSEFLNHIVASLMSIFISKSFANVKQIKLRDARVRKKEKLNKRHGRKLLKSVKRNKNLC